MNYDHGQPSRPQLADAEKAPRKVYMPARMAYELTKTEHAVLGKGMPGQPGVRMKDQG